MNLQQPNIIAVSAWLWPFLAAAQSQANKGGDGLDCLATLSVFFLRLLVQAEDAGAGLIVMPSGPAHALNVGNPLLLNTSDVHRSAK